VKKALGIKSPSRVFRNEVGQYLPAGIVAGIDDGQSALDRRVAGMVSVAKIGKVAPGDFGAGVAASAPIEQHFHVTAPADLDQPATARIVANQLMWRMTS
jgi:hypothetical protein